jgi:hypothetical protein
MHPNKLHPVLNAPKVFAPAAGFPARYVVYRSKGSHIVFDVMQPRQ